ncbi:UBA/THIF-type NAD/FAD binding protein [Pirellula staleyi DSM 6068]|uniref:UBA/THIF-type NAD/FAD binding protein n=1 Tax=Pirellula staleyi (strain ATCC 27377 / DSM 6068 / ICPB 4128) TaxID=530564 RepID=D2R1K4_PIRSD|nr:ThiF family adenylyltransferase [Pirellula staleyi]ADB16723.1 UBA/THIF-type NAD/FAD binding protein [Pirellula staleyi DSM 6068]
MSDDRFARYSRQVRFASIGKAGQERLAASRALVVGCGALGSMIASHLVRAGVGFTRIVDRDFLELSNLQRQTLYTEADVASGFPKAICAEKHLREINSEVEIEAVVADIVPSNIEQLARNCDVVVDGTDNFETRMLINDVCVKLGIAWVYGGCLGAEGQSMTILPGESPCLRCVMPEPPDAGSSPTCDAAGILGTIIGVIASLQASEAIKILSGNRSAVSKKWTIIDLWDSDVRQLRLDAFGDRSQCPCCGKREFPWLSGERASYSAVLCGRNSVQLSFPGSAGINLAAMAERLRSVGEVSQNKFLVRLKVGDYQITLFADGRAVVSGTEEIAEARSVYAQYIGS